MASLQFTRLSLTQTGAGTSPEATDAAAALSVLLHRPVPVFGQHPRREPSRSAPRTIVLRLLHDRSQAGKSHRRPCLRQRPARPRVRSGWRRDDRAAPLEPNEAADARPAPPATLLAALVGRTLLRLDPVAASDPRPMGISSRELPWLRSTRLPRCPLQAILR